MRTTDDAHRGKRRPVSRAELGRIRGVCTLTVSQAARGPLAPACLPGGRIDLTHPACTRWLEQTDPAQTLPVAEPAGRGVVPPREFADRAEADLSVVLEAMRGELAGAVVAHDGGELVDLRHPMALAFMAARPFGWRGAPTVGGQGFLVPTLMQLPHCVDAVDVDHPVAWAYCARKFGRVPTNEEMEALRCPSE